MRLMQFDFIDGLFVLMLATFIGLDVIRRVSRLLHTPLMSLTNAISAIAVVGAILLAGEQESELSTVLGAIAVFASTTNIVSGFLITDRMLKMFKKREPACDGGAGPFDKLRAGQVIDQLIQLVYLVATALFIFSLKWMSDPSTARRGVFAGVGGMALAIIGTLLHPLIIGYSWIAIPLVLGALAGIPLSWVPLTAVPQRTALSHAFGGLAAGLVGTAKYFLWAEHEQLTTFRMGAIAVEVILGYLTCTGSLIAAGKLQEVIPTRPIIYRGQNVINFTLLAAAVGDRRPADDRSRPHVSVSGAHRARARVRRAARAADRRRRHADGHLAAEFVRRPGGRGDGLRHGEQAAHHRRRARRRVGSDSVDRDVQGDEPLVHERAVRRVRPGEGRRRARSSSARRRARRQKTPRSCSRTPRAS